MVIKFSIFEKLVKLVDSPFFYVVRRLKKDEYASTALIRKKYSYVKKTNMALFSTAINSLHLPDSDSDALAEELLVGKYFA